MGALRAVAVILLLTIFGEAMPINDGVNVTESSVVAVDVPPPFEDYDYIREEIADVPETEKPYDPSDIYFMNNMKFFPQQRRRRPKGITQDNILGSNKSVTAERFVNTLPYEDSTATRDARYYYYVIYVFGLCVLVLLAIICLECKKRGCFTCCKVNQQPSQMKRPNEIPQEPVRFHDLISRENNI